MAVTSAGAGGGAGGGGVVAGSVECPSNIEAKGSNMALVHAVTDGSAPGKPWALRTCSSI